MPPTVLELKAFGDLFYEVRNRAGGKTTHCGPRVITGAFHVGDRVLHLPYPVFQHADNVLAIPVATALDEGVYFRFDRWKLFDMVKGRALPRWVEHTDPGGSAMRQLVLCYVQEARRLVDEDALTFWMQGILERLRLTSPVDLPCQAVRT
jgi:hypothetical protein